MKPDVTVALDANVPQYPGAPPQLHDGALGADVLPIGRG